MRASGWRGSTRKRKIRTTVPDPAADRFPDLAGRNFKAAAPGLLLVADFTYVPLVTGGRAYVAFVTGALAGTIRGWDCSGSKETPFVQRAIRQAGDQLRRLGHPVTLGAVRHSDAGSQYTSVRFAQALLLEGLAGSTGSAGDALDNALAETTIGLCKAECGRDGSPFRDGPLRTCGDVEKITAAWVHWHSTERLMHRTGPRPRPKPTPPAGQAWPDENHPQSGKAPGLTWGTLAGDRLPGQGPGHYGKPGARQPVKATASRPHVKPGSRPRQPPARTPSNAGQVKSVRSRHWHLLVAQTQVCMGSGEPHVPDFAGEVADAAALAD